jgi:DNA polymerase elongation subunit (family B)
MAKIIFDIETVGVDFESLDETTQESLIKRSKNEDDGEPAQDKLGLYPLTAQIVTIGMLELETDKGFVYYQVPGKQPERISENSVEYVSCTHEKQLLEMFWARMDKYEQFITFNGRTFDCPFIMLRSALNHVRAAKNLIPDRYRSVAHIDLMEKLTFLGALRKRFSLHMWCNAFGIKSPKEDGISGSEVKGVFKEGRYLDIARYCMRDVAATKELFIYWDKYLNVPGA